MRTHLALFVILAACDGGSETADAPPPVIDADDTDASPPDAFRADAIPNDPQGVVIIAEQVDDGTAQSAVDVTIFAGHLFGPPVAGVGECEIFDENQDEQTLGAGVVSITGTTVPITMTPDGSTPPVAYTPTPDPVPTDLFAPGAMINVAAVGDQVPAFSGSVTAPAVLEGVAFPTSVSRAGPNTVTWTAGTDESAWVWLIGIDPQGGGFGIIWCRTTDSGSYSIPPAATAMFSPALSLGLVIVWRINETPVTAGAWTIQLTAADAVSSAPLPIGP